MPNTKVILWYISQKIFISTPNIFSIFWMNCLAFKQLKNWTPERYFHIVLFFFDEHLDHF